MLTKVADTKGRISLGARFAGKTFIIRRRKSGALILEPAVVLPEREAWLYQNKEALESVKRGLAQARDRDFSETPPNLEGDESLIAESDR